MFHHRSLKTWYESCMCGWVVYKHVTLLADKPLDRWMLITAGMIEWGKLKPYCDILEKPPFSHSQFGLFPMSVS